MFADAKALADWEDLREACFHEKNYANLRRLIQIAAPPLIPYPGMYLSDLLFTDEGNKDTIDGLINFAKFRLVSQIIRRVQQYQLTGYDLTEHLPLQKMLLEVTSLDDDTLYEISHYLEPKEGKEPGDRPTALDKYNGAQEKITLKVSRSSSLGNLVRILLS